MKLTSILIILLFAFTLAACGGGGSSRTPEVPPMTDDGDGGDDGDMEPEGPTEEEMAARIMGLTVAIADPDGDGNPTGGLKKASRPEMMAITAGPNGVIMHGTDDTLGKEDKYVDDQFGMPSEAAMIQRWQGTTQSRTTDNVVDELVVYHNSEDPKDRAYMMYFAESNVGEVVNNRPAVVGSIVDGRRADDGTLDTADTTPNEKYDAGLDNNEGRIGFGDGSDVTVPETEEMLFGGSIFNFTSGQVTDRTVPGADVASTNAKENERTGTFAGIPGTYICTGGATACTATSDAKGNLATLSAGWVFQPTASGAAGKVQDVVLDVDYLAFGYWLQTTTDADGTKTYGVNVFGEGSQAFPVGDSDAGIEALTGTATYNGKATGMYAMKSFSDGAGVPTEAGQFTANAKLTASFGGGSVASNSQFTIAGTVSNFMNMENEAISGGGWTVNLMQADFSGRTATPGGPGSVFDNSFEGDTTGGGSWEGMFYGPTVADDTDTDANEAATGYPTGVAGEFNAHLGNGHVIGAFGATK